MHGFIEARVSRLAGARIVLEFPSVGATENLMTAAVLAKGQTVIENAAREPEITDLAAFLNRMGAHIIGAGTSTIEIEGVGGLEPVDTEIMGDRIEAGTLLMACGIAGGEIALEGARLEHLEMVALKLGEMGMRVSPTPDGIWARADERLQAVDIATLPFPGFATDFMPIVVALLAAADGTAIVTENVFDNRLRVRRRAGPHGRRRPHRGPPRRGPRVSSASRAPRCGPSTCGPAPPSCSPASPPRARRSSTTATTSTGATPTSPPPSAPSAPTSSGPDRAVAGGAGMAAPQEAAGVDAGSGLTAILEGFGPSVPTRSKES